MTIQVERRNEPEFILKLNSLLLAYFTSVGFGFQIPAHFLPPKLNGFTVQKQTLSFSVGGSVKAKNELK